jgi:glycine/D-amino acid oxidase-like deaminating enzyme
MQRTYSLRPFWMDEPGLSDTLQHQPPLPHQTEVLVIGGGLTGLSAALTLARAGKLVALVDANQVGSGASSRNGGLLGPSFHKLGVEGLIKQFGNDTANEIMHESMAGFNWLLDFIQKEKINCQLKRCGRFRGALKAKHLDALQTQAETIARTIDYPVSVVSKQQQHTEVGSNKYHGGVVYHSDASLHPARLVSGVIKRVKAAGAEVFSHTKVTGINQTFSGFDVNIGSHIIQAQTILIATNGYTDHVFPGLKRRILPLRSSMIATGMLSESLVRSVSPKLRSHGGTDRLVFYYRPSPDGKRLLFGGRAMNYQDKPLEYANFLYKNMTSLFPQLADAEITHAWSGLVAYTFDHMPHIGKLDGMYYAMGYCGSGVARASYLGNKIAQKILNTGGETPFANFPFESRFMYTGNPWFMPALLRWHSFADRMGW